MLKSNRKYSLLLTVFVMTAMISCSLVSGLAGEASDELQTEDSQPDEPVSIEEPAESEPAEDTAEGDLPAENLDLCSLLDDEQVSSALGLSVQSSDSMGLANCTYTPVEEGMVTLSVSAAQGEEAKALTVLGLQLLTMFGAPDSLMEGMNELMNSLPELSVWEVVQGSFNLMTEIGYIVEPAEEFGSTALWGKGPDITTLVIVREDTYLSFNLTGVGEEDARDILAELAPAAEQSLPARFTVPTSGEFSFGTDTEDGDQVNPADQGLSSGPGIWVANSGGDAVVVVDPESMQILGTVHTNQHPYDLALYGDELYAASQNDGTVSYVDIPSLEQKAIFDADVTDIVGVDVNQEYVYVSNCTVGKVTVLERVTMEPVETFPVKQCWDVLIGLDSLWVPAGDASLVQYDAETYEEFREIDVGSGPALMALSEEHVWVGCINEHTVHKVDPVIHRTVKVIRLDTDGNMHDIAVGEGFVWVAVTEGIIQIDPDRGEVLGMIDLSYNPTKITAGLGSLWVTDFSTGMLHRIDPLSGEETGSVFVGDRPMDVLVSPD